MRAALALVVALVALGAPSVAQAQPAPQPSASDPNAPPVPTQPQPPGGAPPGPGSSPSPGRGGMHSGGLAPPAPLGAPPNGGPAPTTPPSPTVSSDLDEAKEDDAGRGLSWFWIEAQGGFEHVGLQTFNVDEQALSAGFVETSASGGAISAGLGAQLVFVTLGARGGLGIFPEWQIARIGGELGFRIPIGFVEPRFDLGGGYAALANLEDGVVPEAVSITGFYARASAGVDFYPADVLALGVLASFDFMGLTRPGVSPADLAALRGSGDISDAQASLLAAEGSGYGSTIAVQGTAGLHF